MEKIIEKEQIVQNLLDQGNREEAVKLLFELVVACAEEKNFQAAEAMRSRIYEIDAMALTEIIRSGEIIEEAKSSSIDKAHREIWAKLYEKLSIEEANVFYFALTKATYQAGETIFQEGDCKPRLYFINSGQAKIVYFEDGREVFLKTVEPGQFVGEDTFFSYSVCALTMTAICRTEVMYLDSVVLQAWSNTSPLLESKLQSFVSIAENISDLLKARQIDRRRLKRVNLEGKAIAQLMSSSGDQVGKPFKVELCDISRAGVSFLVSISKRETAGQLCGKRVCINYVHHQMDSSIKVEESGTIVAVHVNPFEDSTVHVKFDTLLPETLIEQLATLTPGSQDPVF